MGEVNRATNTSKRVPYVTFLTFLTILGPVASCKSVYILEAANGNHCISRVRFAIPKKIVISVSQSILPSAIYPFNLSKFSTNDNFDEADSLHESDQIHEVYAVHESDSSDKIDRLIKSKKNKSIEANDVGDIYGLLQTTGLDFDLEDFLPIHSLDTSDEIDRLIKDEES